MGREFSSQNRECRFSRY